MADESAIYEQIRQSLACIPRELQNLVIGYMPFEYNFQLFMRIWPIVQLLKQIPNEFINFWCWHFNGTYMTYRADNYEIRFKQQYDGSIVAKIGKFFHNNDSNTDVISLESLWKFINGSCLDIIDSYAIKIGITDNLPIFYSELRKNGQDEMRRAIAIDECAAIARVWRARRGGAE